MSISSSTMLFAMINFLLLAAMAVGVVALAVYLLCKNSGGHKCLFCGRRIPADGQICPYCGEKAQQDRREA